MSGERDVLKEVADILRLPPGYTPGDVVEGVRQVDHNLRLQSQYASGARREAIAEAQSMIRALRDGATEDGNHGAASCAEWIAVAIGALAGIPDCPICAEMGGRKCVNHRDGEA